MEKQERRFPLSFVSTTIGQMGQIHLDPSFLDVLGVQPGDCVCFEIDHKGGISVRGEKAGLPAELQAKIEAGNKTLQARYPHLQGQEGTQGAETGQGNVLTSQPTSCSLPSEVTQAPLFADVPLKSSPKRRARKR